MTGNHLGVEGRIGKRVRSRKERTRMPVFHDDRHLIVNIFRNRLLRNVLFVSLAIVIGLPFFDTIYVYASFRNMLKELSVNEAIRTAVHISSMLQSQEEKSTPGFIDADFSKEIDLIRRDFELEEVKIFSKSGEIIYSTNKHDIGSVNNNKYFKEIESRGKVHAEFIPRNGKSLEGRRLYRDVIETYVPVLINGNFAGAFEIYYDITYRKSRFDQLTFRSFLTSFILALTLFSLVVLMLLSASKNITAHERAEGERLQRERLQGVLEMAGAVCHELNQPMQVVSGHSELILRTASQESISKHIKSILGQIDRMSTIVKKLMKITRYETRDYLENRKIIDIDKASKTDE